MAAPNESAAQVIVGSVVRKLRANRASPEAVTIVPSRTLTRPSASRAGTRAASASARIVATAARWIHDGRRLDMRGLADELGVSRVTLFRRVGSREELLSQALWLLTERMLEAAAARWEAERPEGELHTPGTGRHINAHGRPVDGPAPAARR